MQKRYYSYSYLPRVQEPLYPFIILHYIMPSNWKLYVHLTTSGLDAKNLIKTLQKIHFLQSNQTYQLRILAAGHTICPVRSWSVEDLRRDTWGAWDTWCKCKLHVRTEKRYCIFSKAKLLSDIVFADKQWRKIIFKITFSSHAVPLLWSTEYCCFVE
jgi:hypothetical protein